MDIALFVGNLSKTTTESELKALFMQVGDVSDVRIMRDRNSGDSRGFGYLSMSAQSEADKAVSKFNHCEFGGHRLKVSLAKPRAVSAAAGP